MDVLFEKSVDIFDLELYHKNFDHVLRALPPCCRYCKYSLHKVSFYNFGLVKRKKSELEKKLEVEHFSEEMECEDFNSDYISCAFGELVKKDHFCSHFEYCRLEIQKAYEFEKQCRQKKEFETEKFIEKQNNVKQLRLEF